MKRTRPEVGLERILVAIERDVLDASDEEILSAARDLGMDPSMKGTAALIGVTLAPRLVSPDRRGGGPGDADKQKRARTARRRSKEDVPPSS